MNNEIPNTFILIRCFFRVSLMFTWIYLCVFQICQSDIPIYLDFILGIKENWILLLENILFVSFNYSGCEKTSYCTQGKRREQRLLDLTVITVHMISTGNAIVIIK